MGRPSIVWGRLAGALMACFLAVFALTPALDAVVCEGDEPSAAHAVFDHAAAAAEAHQHRGHTDSSGVCAHGHCHQAASEAATRLDVHASGRVEHHAFKLALASVEVSGRHFRLIRPPRA